MLRITLDDTPAGQRWILQGQLIEPWVSELRAQWDQARPARQERNCLVDLGDVTHIDKSGEELLLAMADAGAELVARGLYTKHVVEDISKHANGLRNPFCCS
jgi:hypothetical protein